MKTIFKWNKTNVIEIRCRIIVKINKHKQFVKFEIKNYVWLNRRNIKTIKSFNKLNDKNLNFFVIINKREQIYELKLFEIMHIYLMFHFWLLRKNEQNFLKKQQNDLSKFIIFEKNSKWKMNDILKFKYNYHRLQYKINWTNYSHDCVWYYVNANQFKNV